MQIVAALFADDLAVREVDGPSTRIDFTGVKFSEAPTVPYPVTVEPHLFLIVRCGPEENPDGVLEVRFLRRAATQGSGDASAEPEQVARNVQPLHVDPGRFQYRLVRAELDFHEPGTVEAHCTIDRGEPVVVPFTLLPAITAPAGGDAAPR